MTMIGDLVPDLHCPYCGHTQKDPKRCEACGGLFEPLSRQATLASMGPWFIRDEDKPFMPGFSAEILRKQAAAGRIGPQTLVRGPTTHQFWLPALEVPGLSRLLGACHSCGGRVAPQDSTCPGCDADLSLPVDRDDMGVTRAPHQAPRTPTTQKPVAVSPALRSSQTNPPAVSEPAAFDVDAEHEHDHEHDTHEAEELWDVTGAARSRVRRKRGQDPIIIAMGVIAAMCAIGVVILALSLGGNKNEKSDEEDAGGDKSAAVDEDAAQPTPPRNTPSEQVISDLQIRIELTTEQLQEEDIPTALQPELDALLARIALAQSAIDDGRVIEGYDILREIDREANELVDTFEQFDEHDEVLKLQASALSAREMALADEAPQWAPEVWAEAEKAFAAGQTAIEQGDDFSAYDFMVQAQDDFEFAQSQASLGFLAIQAQTELEEEIAIQFLIEQLEAHGGDAWREMILQRDQGQGELESHEYGAALNSFETALRRLQLARNGVRLSQGVMFYAFAAGYQATDALIAIAAGDGLTVEKRGLIEDAFDDLRLDTPLSRALPSGTEPDFSAVADVLVNQAREAITNQHGAGAQISYRIGFQFRIIEQTLSNPVLDTGHRTRISRALQTLDELTALAEYAPDIRERFDTFRRAMRSTSSDEKLQAARDEWSDLIVMLRTYEQAMPIVNPSATAIKDPEMFPDQ